MAINPSIKINDIDDFLSPDNLDEHLHKNAGNPLFVVLDATDDVKMKIELTAYCKKNKTNHKEGIPLVICGGAGGKLDTSRIVAADLAKTTQDPLLSKIRYSLRKLHGFSNDPKKKLGVMAIYSDEPRQGVATGGLACSGYGSAVTVTATFGFIAAAEVLKLLKAKYLKSNPSIK